MSQIFVVSSNVFSFISCAIKSRGNRAVMVRNNIETVVDISANYFPSSVFEYKVNNWKDAFVLRRRNVFPFLFSELIRDVDIVILFLKEWYNSLSLVGSDTIYVASDQSRNCYLLFWFKKYKELLEKYRDEVLDIRAQVLIAVLMLMLGVISCGLMLWCDVELYGWMSLFVFVLTSLFLISFSLYGFKVRLQSIVDSMIRTMDSSCHVSVYRSEESSLVCVDNVVFLNE